MAFRSVISRTVGQRLRRRLSSFTWQNERITLAKAKAKASRRETDGLRTLDKKGSRSRRKKHTRSRQEKPPRAAERGQVGATYS